MCTLETLCKNLSRLCVECIFINFYIIRLKNIYVYVYSLFIYKVSAVNTIFLSPFFRFPFDTSFTVQATVSGCFAIVKTVLMTFE